MGYPSYMMHGFCLRALSGPYKAQSKASSFNWSPNQQSALKSVHPSEACRAHARLEVRLQRRRHDNAAFIPTSRSKSPSRKPRNPKPHTPTPPAETL